MSTVTGLMRVKVPTHRDTPHTFHSLFKLALVHVPFEHCMFNMRVFNGGHYLELF